MKNNIFSMKTVFTVLAALCTVHAVNALTPAELKGTSLITKVIKNNNILNEDISKGLSVWLRFGMLFGAALYEERTVENYGRHGDQKHATINLLNKLFHIGPDFCRISTNSDQAGRFLSLKGMGLIVRTIYNSKKPGDIEDLKNQAENALEKKCKKEDASLEEYPKFIDTLIGSLRECNYWEETNGKSYYPKNFTLCLLYSFVYKKADNRPALKNFFKELCTENLKGTDPSAATEGWANGAFNIKTLNELTFAFEKADEKNAVLDAADSAAFEEIIAAGIVKNLTSMGGMLEMCGYGDAFPTGSKTSFSDCSESTLRNICDIYSLDDKKGTFSANILKNVLWEKAKLPQNITNFYGTYGANEGGNKPWTSAALGKTNLRNAWLKDVIQTNIPYATYNKRYKNNVLKEKKGAYVPSTSKLKKIEIAGLPATETFNNDDVNGYDLDPSTANLIIMLNSILGLNLFDKKNMEEEITQKNFVETYLPQLAKALKSTITIKTVEIKDEQGITKVRDILTFTTNKNQKFRVLITRERHAETEKIKTGENKEGGCVTIQDNQQPSPELQNLFFHAFNYETRIISYSSNKEFCLRGCLTSNTEKIEGVTKIALSADLAGELAEECVKRREAYENDRNFYNTILTRIFHKQNV